MGALVILTFRPIKVWPEGWRDAGRRRESSPFRAPYENTLQLLDRELEHLSARDAFLQVDASDRDVRLDGQLRADAKVEHPGVILTIDTKKLGTLTYGCDRFEGWYSRPSWQSNLRAIALGLEALRKVERYGIAERGQQYAGYRELGSGIAVPAAMTIEEATRLLLGRDNPNGLTADEVAAAYRSSSKIHHPDRGGDAETFRRLTAARDLLLGTVS
jgi:hypothetical protein